jgi:hypothetical protein
MCAIENRRREYVQQTQRASARRFMHYFDRATIDAVETVRQYCECTTDLYDDCRNLDNLNFEVT